MTKNILITAGETSGDIHAANLIKNLKKLNPDFAFFGLGGERMEGEGADLVERMDKFSIIGVWEALVALKYIRQIYKKLMKKIKEMKPDIAILVDYPGFNLTLARGLKKLGVKVVYYITPQIWAWGASRINLIKRYVDKAIVIFKFEEELFKKHGIDASFVGHPLLDGESEVVNIDRKSLNLEEGKFTIALLPGSRESEVKRILPIMLKTACFILNKRGVQFVLLKSSGVKDEVYNKILEKSSLLHNIGIFKDNTPLCLSLSDFVFTCSGTATLESAIMEKPMLIIYKTSLLTAFLFRVFAKTPFIGLVNIIAKKEIVPEILQYEARPKRLASRILSIISSKDRLEEQIQNLRWVKRTLGTPGASMRAARIVADLYNRVG